MSNSLVVTKVTKISSNGALEVEYFRGGGAGITVGSRVNDNGDLTVYRRATWDPYSIEHTLAVLAKGTWARADTGYEPTEISANESLS
jgi:hypothetical protein